MTKKIHDFKFVIRNCSRGMSYVELIVVLSIFSVLSGVAIYNYGDFQDKVDVKNLASDISSKIIEAQRSALTGSRPVGASPTWKPTYGVYFDPNTDPKNFIYFVDTDSNLSYLGGFNCTGECLDKITIVKNNNYISRIDTYSGVNPSQINSSLSILFRRPDSSAIFVNSTGSVISGFDYAQITVSSPSSKTAKIKIYPSGRVQIN